jgi:acyl-coenzyme A synthetase/AMP-(fatty) acid ligase
VAEVLARGPLRDVPPAPENCVVSGGALPSPVGVQFAARFGIPLRPSYGMSELGVVTTDDSPPDRIRTDAAGRPLPGVRVCIGEDPSRPSAPGVVGRVLVRSPWAMLGYGFPPDLDASRLRDGWLTTQDVGSVDADGFLTLGGRADDAFKTAAGHLVAPAAIARCLVTFPGVSDAAVVPLEGAVGRLIGALVEAPASVSPAMLRKHAAASLPKWAQPRVVVVTPELPRVSGGKVDRRACIAVLAQEDVGEEVTW